MAESLVLHGVEVVLSVGESPPRARRKAIQVSIYIEVDISIAIL